MLVVTVLESAPLGAAKERSVTSGNRSSSESGSSSGECRVRLWDYVFYRNEIKV